jgi:hypothetical protein
MERTWPSSMAAQPTWTITASLRFMVYRRMATPLIRGVMRTISSVASANAEGVRKRPFGRISLGLGSILVVGVLLLVVGEASIASRVHDEELLEAEQPRSPGSFSLRWEVHHPFGGLAYVYTAPLNVEATNKPC